MKGATKALRTSVAVIGVVLAITSATRIVPSAWPTYAVFFALALALSFVWLDIDTPASVTQLATATAFVYIAGFPVVGLLVAARLIAYSLTVAAARRGLIALPRPFRPPLDPDPVRAREARLDLAAMQGLAIVGYAVRLAVIHLAGAAGVRSLVAMVVLGEPAAYVVMGAISAQLSLPTAEYVGAARHRLSAEDEHGDVIFSAVLLVPLLVVLIVFGWVEHGLVGAAAWSLGSLAPHRLVQMFIQRRRLLEDRNAALECATESLARKHAEIEEFTYTVAHDLKAPLGAIEAATGRLLDVHALPESARSELTGILRLAGKTGALVVDILEMVRIVSEPEPVETVDLGAVTAQALELLRPDIDDRHVQVEVATPLPAIPGQAKKLRHVVANLIGNAIRFVPPRTGTIAVSATREERCVVLWVRDNGIGIAEEDQDGIFEMFQRGADRNGAAGSGMGLAIVKRIVERHGGEVGVESTPGTGSVFWVRLPAA